MMIWRSRFGVGSAKKTSGLSRGVVSRAAFTQRLVELPVHQRHLPNDRIDLRTLSTLVITKRMCAQISKLKPRDDGHPRVFEPRRGASTCSPPPGPRAGPPHEHVCAAPSERRARALRAVHRERRRPFLATTSGARGCVVVGIVVAEASDARAPREHLATCAPGLGRHGASRCDACDIHARPGSAPSDEARC